MNDACEFLYDMWYIAAPAKQLKRGKTLAKTLLGQEILLGRANDGEVFALRDFCPHRGVPLRYGTFDGETVACCFHGWRFNPEGRCTKIPSLPEDSPIDIAKVKARSYPCREVDGIVWVFVTSPRARQAEQVPEVPASPIPIPGGYHFVTSVVYPCNIDDGAVSLVDPTHNQLVHASWWWRSRRFNRPKQKHFIPHKLGFRMVRHKPSANYRVYKLFGGEITTELTFQLPASRTEHMILGKYHVLFLTTMTPVTATTTALNQFFYSNMPLLNWLKPILARFGKAFIMQDYGILEKQQAGLLAGEHPALMLLGDGDAQGLWYHRLKKDMLEAQKNDLPFENRLPEKTLRWCS